MVQMNKWQPSLAFKLLAVFSIVFGPICFLMRTSSIGPVEKLFYAVSFFPLALLALQLRYLEGKRFLMEMPDCASRNGEIRAWTKQHLLLLVLGLGAAVSVTLLFVSIIFS